MKIVIIDTYYSKFLNSFYEKHTNNKSKTYLEQRTVLLDQFFGTSDFYSHHLDILGHETQDLIVNCLPQQVTWARENGFRYSTFVVNLQKILQRLPFVGRKLAIIQILVEIAEAQINSIQPDVLYCQDLSFFPPEVLLRLRKNIKLIVGQIASPLPSENYVKAYDLILTSFPHFVPRLRALGVGSEFFRIGFDPRVLEKLGSVKKDIQVSFVGGLSNNHSNAIPAFEYLARNTPIKFLGYGVDSLNKNSPIRKKHLGEVWGLDMYRALARSNITLNRHIDVAENNANNMRLFEATGVGTMLITDYKDNLTELFQIGKEVVTYSNAQEASELINYYLNHPQEAQAIAKAGQARTIRDHTYKKRMKELLPILDSYLKLK